MNLKPLKPVVFTVLIFFSLPSLSLAMDEECFLPHVDEMTKVREPEFGSSSHVWDIVYAKDGMDVFNDIVPLENNFFLAVGAFTKDKDDEIVRPLVVKFDDRFKPLWEIREFTKETQTIERLIKTKKGFTVLGNISSSKNDDGFYIASYKDDGKISGKALPIFEDGGDLSAKTFIEAQDGGGYIVAAQFVDGQDLEKQYGILYKISNAGNIVWKRSYQTGQSNSINNIIATLDGTYIAMGQVVLEGKKSAGWLLRLDHDGVISWQKTYPRGMGASLQSAAQTKDGDFVVSGKSRPFDYDGQSTSAWVMKTKADGTPLWNRYFRGEYSYDAPDMIVYEDGRASVLLNAQGVDGDIRSHARIVTFSPRGLVEKLEDYSEGQHSNATRLVSGLAGERILVGHAQTSFGENQPQNTPTAAPIYTYDGWILAAPALTEFKDPCVLAPDVAPLMP